jgi:predicted RNA methylase
MSAQLTLGSFAPPLRSDLGQWHTEPKLAARMVEWAGILPGMRVLEPSAGGGNIVRALLVAGAEVTAVELDPAWVRCLSEDKAFSSVRILDADFLALAPSRDYDAVVMNPPLDAGVGGQHISHALRFAPRVVSVIRTHDLHGKGRYEKLWKGARVAGIAFCVNRPRFGKGARADGPQHEFSIIDVRRADTRRTAPRIEWWEV